MTTSSCVSHLASLPPPKCLLAAFLLLGAFCAAQQREQLPDAPVPHLLAQDSAPQAPAEQSVSGNDANITIPAGTRLQLVLTHPVDSHSTPKGDKVFAQTTAPVVVGNQVVIPGGTYVQGTVEKLTRNGTRAQMLMQSVALVFPNGYIAQAGGPVNVESEQWTAWNNPQGRSKALIILAPVVGLGLGMGIGAATDKPHTIAVSSPSGTVPPGFPPLPPLPPLTMTQNTHKGLAIGGIVGGLAGGIAALVLTEHNRQFYLEQDSPLSMTLPQPITLTQSQVDDANRAAAKQSVPVAVGGQHRPATGSGTTTDNRTCYIPGSPGTPGTHIPGTPGVNGAPGTPGIDIPGTPPTPPTPYQCP